MDHVADKQIVLLVDSIINSGRALVEFVQRIRGLDEAVDIVLCCGRRPICWG